MPHNLQCGVAGPSHLDPRVSVLPTCESHTPACSAQVQPHSSAPAPNIEAAVQEKAPPGLASSFILLKTFLLFWTMWPHSIYLTF